MYYLTVSYWFLRKCVQIVFNTCLGFPSCQTYSINNHGEKNCGKFNAQYSTVLWNYLTIIQQGHVGYEMVDSQ